MFCGIDLGTSSVKASVFDEHGRQLAFSRREIDLVLPQTGLAELDPENYLVKVYETLRDVSAQCHGNIASIAVSSQAQAVVPIDRMGNPLYNIIVTMDNRTCGNTDSGRNTMMSGRYTSAPAMDLLPFIR